MRRRWRWFAVIAAAALLAGVVVRSSARPAGIDGELEFGEMGRRVPAHFVGFSIEYRTLGGFMGLPRRPANPLLGRVRATAGEGLTVRVGGNSAERSWPAGWRDPPSTVRYGQRRVVGAARGRAG
jgi:hypothetical protein